MIKEELKGFNINIDDIEPNDITYGAMHELIEKTIIEENVKRFEVILNKNILNIKDRITGIHSYMGLKLSLESLEKDISFIIRPTNELTYDELQQENKQLIDNWNNLKEDLIEVNLIGFEKSFEKRYGKTFTQAKINICNMILNKMEEIEQGSDKNE